jgi:hypothetical protein
VYHGAGCYFIGEEGCRNSMYPLPSQPFVFPDLHNYNRAYIAKRITETIRNGIKAISGGKVDKKLLEKYSSSGLRRGVSTTLAVHDGITPDQRIYFGAWSHHKNGEGYIEGSPALVIPAALAITGRQKVKCGTEVHVPSFAWLGDGPIQQSVNDFLDELCRVDVPELMPGGQLRSFWLASMAAVVMYHPHMRRDLGPSDLVCKKVVKAAKDAKICDARLPAGTSPESVLLEWSRIMQFKTVELNVDTMLPNESVTAHLEFMTSRLVIRMR